MKRYVLVNAVYAEFVLLLHKNRPDWQRNRLNLCGGKIEDGETPEITAVRELFEETGLTVSEEPVCMGKLIGHEFEIFCFNAKVASTVLQTEEDQKPEWFYWDEIKYSPKLIPNLRVIIPLMNSGIMGWEITDNYKSRTGDLHEITIKIPDFVELNKEIE